MTKEQFDQITAWQKITFPKADAISKLYHLKKELDELIIAVSHGDSERDMEYADCFFLLFGSAAADGMSYEDIINCINKKWGINKSRTWGKPDENGVVEHIRD